MRHHLYFLSFFLLIFLKISCHPAPCRPLPSAWSWISQFSFQQLFSESKREARNTKLDSEPDKQPSNVTLTTSATTTCWDVSQLWLSSSRLSDFFAFLCMILWLMWKWKMLKYFPQASSSEAVSGPVYWNTSGCPDGWSSRFTQKTQKYIYSVKEKSIIALGRCFLG